MVAEMQKHKAQMILREISIVRLSQADRKDSNVRTAFTDLERQAGNGPHEDSAEVEKTGIALEHMRRRLSVLGHEEIADGNTG